ncbi:ACP S-malonyltransferase [Sneathiella chinensis]|uniref:Malonyl CoA-acyl carrier protein transacylase n=1 Tax=Sneathiella chinensis TaxID=349750 RepID=A0ABQ5U617_9PROT|nr:ACP S-malonyltransferase [Sneathiella chinensis]GLQ07579.1 malonyl CoA-acyl carrier protein transacylase [Sneathiella chinensis]
MTRAFVFPGQGSQAVGMGKELAEAFPLAAQVFEEVDDALGQSLTKLMYEGPIEDLTLTENAQPALMAVSVAVARVLEQEGNLRLADVARFVAGHSLGEYSALTAAGALELADAARLLKARGQAMQQAVPVGIGAMAALLGMNIEPVEELVKEATAAADEGEVVVAANDNADGQVVLSGHKGAVEKAIELAREKGVRKAMMLPVSAPFHCPLMQPAADVMAEKLGEVTIAPPSVALVANVTAGEVSDPETIRKLLVEQVTGRVRWRESVLFMGEQGISDLVELGTGKVLTQMVRRINKDMTGSAVQSPTDIETFLKSL